MAKRNSERTRALFRGLWAYANGRPSVSYNLSASDESRSACLDSVSKIEVAILSGSSKVEPDSGDLTAAYDTFLDEGERSENIVWVALSRCIGDAALRHGS